MRQIVATICALLASGSGIAKSAPLLSERYASLSCAVVHIRNSEGLGTGFFVSANGLLLTAAHVVVKREVSTSHKTPEIVIAPFGNTKIQIASGAVVTIPESAIRQVTQEQAVVDLALVQTGLKTPCFIPLDTSNTTRVGDHLIAIGFPGNSESSVLYDGFLSSSRVNDPSILPVQGMAQFLRTNREVMRVQMPVTAGVSGSPIINDNNQVVGVIVENPIAIPEDISNLVSQYNSPQGPGARMLIGGTDPNQIAAELSVVVEEFLSSGAGYAVSVSYLEKH